MAEFYPLISGAVAKLPEDTAAARQALYERVRGMLVKQLRSANPAISAAEMERELRSLEEAIDRVEDEADMRAEAGRPTGMPDAGRRMGTPDAAPPARAGGARRVATGAIAVLLVACMLAGGYFAYTRVWSNPGGASIAVVPAGSDAMAIKGVLADYRGAAAKPSDVLVLHVRCGATLVELDADSKAVNPSGHVDDQGRFSIAAKKAFVGEIVKVGVRATQAPPADLKQDFLVLGFFAGEKLELLVGPDGKTIKISPQGAILNAGALRLSSAIPPALIVTRKPDGNIYASGGALVFDEAC